MARNVVTLSALGWLVPPLALGFVVLGSSSCIQIGPDSNDGGADGGVGADTMTHTLGDQCSAIAQEYCERTGDCALQEDVQYCASQGTANCCGSQCNDTSTVAESAVAGCVADLRSADCDTIAAILGGNQDSLPSRCKNIFGD